MRLIYAYFLQFVSFMLPLWPFRRGKFGHWLIGQKQVWDDLKKIPQTVSLKKVWIHCASVGEFEQAKPVINLIKAQNPNIFVAVTFFSPSGFLAKQNEKIIDWISYLPLDTSSNAKRFIAKMQPDIALFVKYELWFNMLFELKRAGIPTALFSAHFTDKHWATQWPGIHLGKQIGDFNVVFAQSEATCNRLSSVGFENCLAIGDTRVDQVLLTKSIPYQNEVIEQFLAGYRTLIIGSNWPEDDHYLFEVLRKYDGYKVIVVPHELGMQQQNRWIQTFKEKIITLDDLELKVETEAMVLYVNRMGLLSKLYRYADLAYVGGGFGRAVHNTLEPLVYGIPVVFGPRNNRFLEVQHIKALGIGTEVSNIETMLQAFRKGLENEEYRTMVAEKISHYVKAQSGAAEHVALWIKSILPSD